MSEGNTTELVVGNSKEVVGKAFDQVLIDFGLEGKRSDLNFGLVRGVFERNADLMVDMARFAATSGGDFDELVERFEDETKVRVVEVSQSRSVLGLGDKNRATLREADGGWTIYINNDLALRDKGLFFRELVHELVAKEVIRVHGGKEDLPDLVIDPKVLKRERLEERPYKVNHLGDLMFDEIMGKFAGTQGLAA